MAESGSGKGIYENLEEAYYSFLDSLDESGIPVYKVVDAIEANNIPSFPIAMVFSIAVLALIGWFIHWTFFAGSVLSIQVNDASGTGISAASVTVFAENEPVDRGTTNTRGEAELSVPLNRPLEITVEKSGFLEKTSAFTAENPEESLGIVLQREITTLRKTINFLEAGTTRLVDKTLIARFSCTGESYNETKSVQNGTTELEVPSGCGVLVATLEGDFSIDNESIFLSSDTTFSFFVQETAGATGSVIVSVADKTGESLPGIDVSLYMPTANNTPGTVYKSGQTSSNGVASFDKIPAGRYYIVAFDRTGNYAEYDGLREGVVQEVTENGFTQFSVSMQDNVAGSIKILIRDGLTDELIEGALVTLSNGETKIAEKHTNAQGRTEFGVGEDITYHLEIDKAGYLIASADARPGPDTLAVLLEQATVENSQSLLVNVRDENGKPLENVRVKLRRNSDRTQVGLELVTGLDGRVIFERVEDGLYFVYAIKPGYGEHTSPPISVNSRQENVYNTRIPIGMGKILAGVLDEQGNPVTDASIRVVDTFSGEVLEDTSTDTDGKKTMSVRADKKVFLVIGAAGYANSVTTQMQMQKDATIPKNIVLRRSIQGFALEFEGLYLNNERVSETTRALSAGQRYTARFRLLMPENTAFEEAMVHIRAGSENSDTIEKDPLYITDARSASQKVQKGTSYSPPDGQATDFAHLTGGNAKWANITFTNTQPGAYEIEADIQVRDEARIGSQLDIWYRAQARSGGFLRHPNDTVLGTAANSAEKEGLYANALKRTYSVGPSSLCGEEFCSTFSITNLREGLTTNLFDEVTAQTGSRYRLNFELGSVSETPFSQAQLSIRDRSSGLAFESFSVRTPSGETRTGSGLGSELSVPLGEIRQDSVISGELILDARKEGSIPLELSIISGTDNATEVFKKTIIVKVLPAEKLNVDVLPKIIVPLINNNMLVRITGEAGGEAPISNAVVTVSVNGEPIVSGQTDSEGVFALTLNSPPDGATIGVLAEKTGFQRAAKELKTSQNILLTEPKQIKLLLTAGGAAFKTLEADLINATLIPLDVDAVAASTDFSGFAEFLFTEPAQGETIAPDSNTVLSGRVQPGPEGEAISQPLTIKGGIGIKVSNSSFDRTWISEMPLEITFGFGEEVDDVECFNAFPGEWKIFGSTTQTHTAGITLTNSCAVNSQRVSLRDVSARIVSGNENLLGSYRLSSNTGEGKSIQLNNAFQSIGPLAAGAEEAITLEFLPQNIISGSTEAKIEFQATHLTGQGEQRIIRAIKVSANVNNLSECVEILGAEEITVQSCPFNTGFGNFGGSFSNFYGSRYGPFDPFANNQGYGTGLPPFIGTDFRQNSIYGDSYYDYQGTTYPSQNYRQPFYSGSYSGSFSNPGFGGGFGSVPFSQGFNNSFTCNQGAFAVRNSCTTPVDVSFEPQAGITVAERTISVAPGEESEVTVEPTNFFGRYSLGVSAKPSESAERATEIRRLNVNVVNEFAKNYQDCISISPAGTLNFNNFFGKPVIVTVFNSCLTEGVFIQENNGAIFFRGTGINTPTNVGSGFREMVESWAYLPPAQFITGADGKVTQVLKFEVVKNLEQYRRNAPPANFFEANEFANIGNLRYFLSRGYYSVFGRTNLIVNFMTPSGLQRSTSFPLRVSDYWSILGFGDSFGENFQTYGDGKLSTAECINEKALDFTHLGYTSHEGEYKTVENGELFRIGEKDGCGTADSLKDVSPVQFTESGVTMRIKPDPDDEKHELIITFEAPNGVPNRIDFRKDSQGRVVRVSPPGRALVRLPIKINIERTDTIGETPGGGTGTGTFVCTEGQSGTDIYRKLGLQHLHYKWEADPGDELGVKEDACNALERDGDTPKELGVDSGSAPWFCDGAQAMMEFDRKVERVKNVVNNADLENTQGTCTEEEGFDCDESKVSENEKGKNKNSLELFRYVLSQKNGYFTQNNSEVLELLDADKSILEQLKVSDRTETNTINGLVQRLETINAGDNYLGESEELKDTETQKTVLSTADSIMRELQTVLAQPGNKGIEVVYEVHGWSYGEKPGYVSNPETIGATELGENWYVLPLGAYRQFDNTILESFDACSSAECDYKSFGKLEAKFIQELIQKGKWKVTARNTNDLGELAKELVMRKGEWPTKQSGYDNFREFHSNNIRPDVYLVEEDYSQGLFSAYKEKYARSTLDAKLPGTSVAPGLHRATLKYRWAGDNDRKTEVSLDNVKTLSQVSAGYADNVLFTIPIDGELDWGTGFLGTGEALYFNNGNPEDGYAATRKTSSGVSIATLDYRSSYADTKTGKLMDITKNKFTVSPSDPIRIDVSARKTSGNESGGFLYSLEKQGETSYLQNTMDWSITNSSVSGYGTGSIESAQRRYNELCTDTQATGTNIYNGFIIGGSNTGTVEYTGVAFIPTIVTTDRHSLWFQCIKQSGSASATYLLDNTNLGSLNARGEIGISAQVKSKISTVPQKEKYNLQGLLELVDREDVCIDSTANHATLSWNDRKFREEA